jgi:ankyrin repeat protein
MPEDTENCFEPDNPSVSDFRCLAHVPFLARALCFWLASAIATIAVADEIHSAVTSGDLSRVRALLQASPALLDAPELLTGQTPLHYALQSSRIEITQELLARGANPNLRDKSGSTPLMVATSWGRLRETELLLAHGADLTLQSSTGTPLHTAVQTGNRAMVEFLLNKGVNPNATNQAGCVPLDGAANSPEIVTLLLDHDARFSAGRPGRETLLHSAASRPGATNVIAILLARGARRGPQRAGPAGPDAAASGQFLGIEGHRRLVRDARR